jgi:hypothetical protein
MRGLVQLRGELVAVLFHCEISRFEEEYKRKCFEIKHLKSKLKVYWKATGNLKSKKEFILKI